VANKSHALDIAVESLSVRSLSSENLYTQDAIRHHVIDKNECYQGSPIFSVSVTSKDNPITHQGKMKKERNVIKSKMRPFQVLAKLESNEKDKIINVVESPEKRDIKVKDNDDLQRDEDPLHEHIGQPVPDGPKKSQNSSQMP
jgi:hypothetical protein